MKLPKPELQNTRVIRLAKRFALLPLVFLLALYGWVRAAVLRRRSPARVRTEDQQRQSRARRTLRGLPADHVQ